MYNIRNNVHKIGVKAMVKDTIKAVKLAEQNATKLAKETLEKQEQMLTEAKQKVRIEQQLMESDLLILREKKLEEVTKKNEDLMAQAMASAREEVSLLQKNAEAKEAEVFHLILTELLV